MRQGASAQWKNNGNQSKNKTNNRKQMALRAYVNAVEIINKFKKQSFLPVTL